MLTYIMIYLTTST